MSGIQFFISPLEQAWVSSLLKFFTWTIPAVILMKKYDYALYVPIEKIFTNRFKVMPYILIILLMVGYIFFGEWMEYGKIQINTSFNPVDLIGMFLFVGITEEIVFRGWLLNVFLKKTTRFKAIFFSSILFLSIHFPIWIKRDSFIQNFISGAFVNVLVLSVIFSITFIKSKNILVPIFIHMIWDLTLLLF